MPSQVQAAVVVIKDPSVEERRVGDNKFLSQVGFLRTSEDESLKIEISLPRGHAGYAAGVYQLAGQSFDRDQYGRPSFGKRGLYLVPVSAAGQAK